MTKLEFVRREVLAERFEQRHNVEGRVPQAPAFVIQLLTIIRRRKWIILGAIIGALVLGLTVTLLMTSKYTATSTIEIRRETRNVAQTEGSQAQIAAMDQEFYNTQYGLLQSRSLAERVAADLRLPDSERFFLLFQSGKADEWFENGRLIRGAPDREERLREAGEILIANFSFSTPRLSRLVNLRFTSPDPAFSKQVADAWAVGFVQLTLQRQYEATSYARQFLEGRLAQLRSRIHESERVLVGYAANHGIVNLPGAVVPAPGPQGGVTTTTTERSLAAEDLGSLNAELNRAVAERIHAQSRLKASGGQLIEALQNDAISGLRQRRAELTAEYARMMVQFEPDYPPARALQTQIQQLGQGITREEARVRNSVGETYTASAAREQQLRKQVNLLQNALLDMRRRSIQYNILQRDVDTNRQLYDALLQRYKEIGVAGGVGVNNISIVDRALPPERPSSPWLLLNMIVALLAGMIIGVIAAYVLEQVDQGIRDPKEIEEALGVPLLGTIPKLSAGAPLELLEDPKSSISEAYISLLTTLSFSTDHGVPRTLVVSSTRPQEGKSTTAYALARLLARSGHKTLLIDGDMRSPSVHHLVDSQNAKGLSNYLSGDDDLTNLIQSTSSDGLFAMTAGPQPPSAAELLSGDRFQHLLAELIKSFHHVIVDSPPVMGLADAPLIGNRVEGTVFIIQSHQTNRNMARLAVDRIAAGGAQIIGAIVTKYDVKRAPFGYGYEYNYGYNYGDDSRVPSIA